MQLATLCLSLVRRYSRPENLYVAGALSALASVLASLLGVVYWWSGYGDVGGVGVGGVGSLFFYLVPFLLGLAIVHLAGGVFLEGVSLFQRRGQ